MALYALRTTNVPVPFDRLRKMWLTAPMQEGVAGATDLKVSQRAAGANMSVDIAPGAFWIQTDTDTPDGLVPGYSDVISNQTVTASHATLPRIDQVVVQYNDSSLGAGVGGDTPTPRVLAGTATAGATLDNRTGAVALPSDALRVADILVPAASTTVTTANIRDRRPWARGAFAATERTAGNGVVTAVTAAAIFASDLQVRIECSGAPLRVSWHQMVLNNTVGAVTAGGLFVDGAVPPGYVAQHDIASFTSATANAQGPVSYVFVFTPTAGSHVLVPTARVSAGSGTYIANTSASSKFTVEEIVRPNANNGTT